MYIFKLCGSLHALLFMELQIFIGGRGMPWKAVKMVFKGKVFRAQIIPQQRCGTPGCSLGDSSPPVLWAASLARLHCRGGEGRQVAGRVLHACPHIRSSFPVLPLPAAGSRCPFPWLAWAHLASDLLRSSLLILRCYLAMCHFAWWWQGQSCLGDPLSGGRSPHCFLKHAALHPSLPIPIAILSSRQGVLLPNTQTESPALPLQWCFLRAFRAQAAQEQLWFYSQLH